jgi:CBS-domain-containing membrane protein
MQRDFSTTDPREMLQSAFARLQDGHARTLPVVKDGQLLGLLTADNLAEVLMIQQALREAHRPALFDGPRTARGRSVGAGDSSNITPAT